MADRVSVDFKVDSVVYRVSGLAKWFYNDADVRKHTGADLTDEADLSADTVIDRKVMYQRALVKMVAKLAPNSALPGTNAAQSNRTRQYRFWCHPEFVREAEKNLPGTNVDPSLLPGNYKIQKVFLPVDSNVA